MVVVHILHYFSKYFTRAIFVEETNSIAQILCTCKHEKRITLIMNKMLLAFAFRPLAVLYMLSCINNNELKRTKLNQRTTLVSCDKICATYIHHIYTWEVTNLKNIDFWNHIKWFRYLCCEVAFCSTLWTARWISLKLAQILIWDSHNELIRVWWPQPYLQGHQGHI